MAGKTWGGGQRDIIVQITVIKTCRGKRKVKNPANEVLLRIKEETQLWNEKIYGALATRENNNSMQSRCKEKKILPLKTAREL